MSKKILLAQAGRFIRLAGTAFIASGIVGQLVHGTADRAAVVAAAVGAVEVAYRVVRPTVPAKAVEKAVLAHLESMIRHSILRMGEPDVPASADTEPEGGGTASAGALPDTPVPPAPPAVP